MNLLFTHLDRLDSQVILKRLTDRSVTLSAEDIILEGYFSQEVIAALSRAFPPPLSFKVEMDNPEILRAYSAFEWQPSMLLYCGVSLLPFQTIQELVEFDNAWQYMRLLATTEVGSILKPLLAVKAKGLVAIDRQQVEFILPMHRIDFLKAWIDQLQLEEITVNWLSGSTGTLNEEVLKSVGSVDQDRLPNLRNWVEQTSEQEDLDFERLFNRAMIALT